MTGVRDFLAQWLFVVLVLVFLAGAAAVAGVIVWDASARRVHREWESYTSRVPDAESETVPIPRQRAGSR